jgi:hypothetical protein
MREFTVMELGKGICSESGEEIPKPVLEKHAFTEGEIR